MDRKVLVSALVLASLAALTSCGDNRDDTRFHSVAASGRVEGRYIVVMRQEAKGGVSLLVKRYAVAKRYQHVFSGFSAALSKAEVQDLLSNPDVAGVYEVGKVRLNTVQENPTWGIDRLDQPSSNLDKKFKYAASGVGVTAYVIDTGITVSHADFGGRAVFGADVTVDKGTRYENVDGHGHGTHVAGTIGSTTWGVAKSAKLVAVKVFDHTGGEASDEVVIAGIDWAIADHAAHPAPAVINMSLGGEASDVLDAAVRKAIEAGITTVVAAGNDNRDACKYSPAREPLAITVASMAQGDRKSSFSNWGKCTDVIAPGSGITSTWKSGGTSRLDGTSMASPHVAGVAAVVLSAYPRKTPAEVQSFIIENAVQGAASGFPADTPNRIASVVWNVPSAQPGEPWSDSWTGNADSVQTLSYPSEKGFEAVVGNSLEAALKGSFWSGGNCDLYLKRIAADGTRVTVASSEGSGMNESLRFAIAEPGRYVLEVKGVSGGKFTLSASLK